MFFSCSRFDFAVNLGFLPESQISESWVIEIELKLHIFIVMASGCCIGENRNSFEFTSVLVSAACEWLLMFLLFLNGLFSFFVTKFARFCKLQTPCLLCSRVDHMFGIEKPGFYWDLICNSHKSEISSLAYCHVHRKLVDVSEMCEGCLLSFATEKKSNPETYRLLVGKLGVDVDDCIDDDGFQSKLNGEDVAEVPLLAKIPVSSSEIVKNCSCCSVRFQRMSQAAKLLRTNSGRVDVGEYDIPLSDSKELIHLHHQDRLSGKRENSLGSPSNHYLGDHGFDRLSRVGYSEVKVTSESESESPFSDDDGGNCVEEDFKDDRCLKPEPVSSISNYISIPSSDDTDTEKLIFPTSSKIESSLLIQEDQLIHIDESHDVSSASTVAFGHGLEELNWNKTKEKIDPLVLSENGHQKENSEFLSVKPNDSAKSNTSALTTSIGEDSKPLISANTDTVSSQIKSDLVSSGPVNMDLNDAYRLAISTKGSLTSPTVAEVLTGRDSSRAYEDLRILISQISTARGLESPWRELSPSPRVQGLGDELKLSDASSSAILQNITKSLSIDRNESGLESFDGSIVSEFEGETTVDRLKRQVELDRKSMYVLYRELEEERNASAVAANQAMAMITRLQEEKAAMQMEALQYQRMMDEQSEYEQEAFQKLNELLAQREKEIQDLEAEVEGYRQRFGDKLMAESVLRSPGDSQETEYGAPIMTFKKKTKDSTEYQPRKSDISVDSLLDFEDEKAYIATRLKKLEEKLHMFSDNAMHVDIYRDDVEEDGCPEQISGQTNDLHSAMEAGSNKMEQPHGNSQDYALTGGEISCGNELTLSSDDSYANVSSSSSLQEHIEANDVAASNYINNKTIDGKSSDLEAILDEVSQLNERLKALEADHDFLEQSMNLLGNGSDGVRFIQEIACHLRELRRIGIARREDDVA